MRTLIWSLALLAVAVPTTAQTKKRTDRVRRNPVVSRPAGIDLMVESVQVARVAGTTDRYTVSASVIGWGRTTAPAGTVFRLMRFPTGSPEDMYEDERVVLPEMTPGKRVVVSHQYTMSRPDAAPITYAILRFELVRPIAGGSAAEFRDANNRNNKQELLGAAFARRAAALPR